MQQTDKLTYTSTKSNASSGDLLIIPSWIPPFFHHHPISLETATFVNAFHIVKCCSPFSHNLHYTIRLCAIILTYKNHLFSNRISFSPEKSISVNCYILKWWYRMMKQSNQKTSFFNLALEFSWKLLAWNRLHAFTQLSREKLKSFLGQNLKLPQCEWTLLQK